MADFELTNIWRDQRSTRHHLAVAIMLLGDDGMAGYATLSPADIVLSFAAWCTDGSPSRQALASVQVEDSVALVRHGNQIHILTESGIPIAQLSAVGRKTWHARLDDLPRCGLAAALPVLSTMRFLEMRKKVTIHSDGGCHGNPGPGGWAATLAYGKHRREISGGSPATTNNRMELQAAIEALRALKEPCDVQFFTDSEYVRKGVTAWLILWKANGWRTKQRQPVKNDDLWRELDLAASRHSISWTWLKGHAGHAGNERCDQLANEQIARIKKSFTPQQLKSELARFFCVPDKVSSGASPDPAGDLAG